MAKQHLSSQLLLQPSRQPTGHTAAGTCLHYDGIHAGGRHLARPLLHQRQLLVKHWREGKWGRSREGQGWGPGESQPAANS